MNETPAQRRTRLIEQYLLRITIKAEDPELLVMQNYLDARRFADAVIAATPQEPEPVYDPIPGEAETRLIELCERLIYRMSLPTHDYAVLDLAAIKRDIGVK